MDKVTLWVRQQIAYCAPAHGRSPDLAARLAEATEAIWSGGGTLFGMVSPTLAERDTLLEEAAITLAQWLPQLDEKLLKVVAELTDRAALPIDYAPHLAKAAGARIAAKKAAEDYAKELDAARRGPRNPELEHAIAEHPDDPAGYSALADWLSTQGSPHGELIRIGLRAEADPSVHGDFQACLARNREALLGKADPRHDSGMIWRHGFLRSVRLSNRQDPVVPDLLALLQHPAGRMIEDLAIGMSGDPHEGDLSWVIKTLVDERPSLRSLCLGDFAHPADCKFRYFRVGALVALSGALSVLRVLITQGAVKLAASEWPSLEHLELRAHQLSGPNARALVELRCPKLRRLDVWYGAIGGRGNPALRDVRELLERRDLPQLRHLGLVNSDDTDKLCELVVGSPLLPQLAVLDLSLGTLSDDGAQVLMAHRDRLAHLERVDISRSWISPDMTEALRTLGPSIIANDMREPALPEDRERAVSE